MTRRRLTLPKPTALDRVINQVAPAWGVKRQHARLAMATASAYIGGSLSRRSLKEWKTSFGDADADLLPDLPKLRERSRDLCRNVPLAGGAINTICTNVVGTGIKLYSRIDREVLSMTEDQADAWEAQAEREWRLWAENQDCDAARSCNFYDLEELVFRQVLENGDVFVLLPRIPRQSSPYTLALQITEADRVCNARYKADSDDLAGGIHRDQCGAPTAYDILDQHPGASLVLKSHTWKTIPAFGSKTGIRNVLHLFRTLRPGQTRGVPHLAPVIESLKQLGRYTEAELMAAVVSAMFTVFVKTASGEAEFNPMAPSTEIGGTSSDEDYKLGNGAIVGLAPGEEIQTANMNRPNSGFDPFVLSILRQIGVGLELPFEILVKHFTASYSAARAALLEAWKFFYARRQWLAMNFCQQVYQTWLYEAVGLGRLAAPGFFNDPIRRMAYSGAEWIGPSKGMINERDEVQAASGRVNLGITTLSEETAQLTGGDWEKKHRQTVKEFKARKEAGLITEGATEPEAPAAADQESPPEQEPDKPDQPEEGEQT